MLTWSIIARACRSASKRAMTCRLSMPGLMTLRATLRWTGSRLLGHPDDAHAAFADLLQELVRADQRAGAFDRDGLVDRGLHALRRRLQKAARIAGIAEQSVDPRAQLGIARRRPRPSSASERAESVSSSAAVNTSSSFME